MLELIMKKSSEGGPPFLDNKTYKAIIFKWVFSWEQKNKSL